MGELQAEKKVEEAYVGDVAEPQEVSETEFTDTSEEGVVAEPKQEEPKEEKSAKPVQTKEQNAEYAKLRRAKEIEQAKEEAYQKGIMEATKGKNKYTGKPIKDAHDVKEYLAMCEIEDKGGDPIVDYHEYQKEKARKDEQKTRELSEQQTKDAYVQKDREAFILANPDVDLPKLVMDEDFRMFSKGRVGNEPMTDIYNDYKTFTSKYSKTADETAKKTAQRLVANSKASPGSLSTTDAPSSYYTEEQLTKMTREEIDANWDKVNASLERLK
jgi:hypothetical protein